MEPSVDPGTWRSQRRSLLFFNSLLGLLALRSWGSRETNDARSGPLPWHVRRQEGEGLTAPERLVHCFSH